MHTIFEEENKIQLLKGQHYNNFFFIKRKNQIQNFYLSQFRNSTFPQNSLTAWQKNALKFEFSERTWFIVYGIKCNEF